MNEKKISSLLNQARIYHNHLCDEDEAIKICDVILKDNPHNRDALLIKAGSLSSIDKEKESFQLLTNIIEKWPDHWEAYYLMGLLLFNTNEEIAMENFMKSISLEKTFDNTICAAQLAYFLENNIYRKLLEQAKEINPPRYAKYMKNCWEWEIC